MGGESGCGSDWLGSLVPAFSFSSRTPSCATLPALLDVGVAGDYVLAYGMWAEVMPLLPGAARKKHYA